MSHFAHHPEAWDEIERYGVAEYLAGHMSDIELLDGLADALTECQQAKESARVWGELVILAHKEISIAEAVYWGSFAR